MHIVVAGATGELGQRITRELLERGARVRALVRSGSDRAVVEALGERGAEVMEIDYSVKSTLKACSGARCVVSALSGLREVIVEAQGRLLEGAVAARVPRFIPSDYSIDFTRLPPGSNRNLDLRREFHSHLDAAPIAATSIYNGAFMDMLTGQAPFILFPLRRVVYWRDADQLMDFTTMDDTAAFTAEAAMDESTPRSLHIAGESLSARDMAAAVSDVAGRKFRLLRAGPLRRLDRLIALTRRFVPGEDEVYPPWQGMQYMRNMFAGDAQAGGRDNDRYPSLEWTGVREVLAAARP